MDPSCSLVSQQSLLTKLHASGRPCLKKTGEQHPRENPHTCSCAQVHLHTHGCCTHVHKHTQERREEKADSATQGWYVESEI